MIQNAIKKNLNSRAISGFRSSIDEMVETVSEMSAQVKEMTRNKDANILVHGLPTQVHTIPDLSIKIF